MTRPGKGARHVKLARAKRNATIKAVAAATTATTYISFDNIYEAHWEGLFGSEEESEIEVSEPEDDISEEAQNAFKKLFNANTSTDTTNFPYQRGSSLSKRQQIRNRNAQKDLQQAAKTQSQPMSQFFFVHIIFKCWQYRTNFSDRGSTKRTTRSNQGLGEEATFQENCFGGLESHSSSSSTSSAVHNTSKKRGGNA